MIRLLLLFYAIGLIIFFCISAIAIRQLLRHRMPNDKAKLAIVIYVAGSGLIIFVSLLGIMGLDWS